MTSPPTQRRANARRGTPGGPSPGDGAGRTAAADAPLECGVALTALRFRALLTAGEGPALAGGGAQPSGPGQNDGGGVGRNELVDEGALWMAMGIG